MIVIITIIILIITITDNSNNNNISTNANKTIAHLRYSDTTHSWTTTIPVFEGSQTI